MRNFPRRPAHGRGALGCLAVAVVLGLSAPVGAQSAADKATARQVATEGIELFRQEQYEKALDRLRRAQALYDAPVHLLYIARCQEKLGQLVEAAETYRSLARYELDDDAPAAFVSAVDSGKKELEALEPRIPTLQVTVEPKDAEVTRLVIDGQEVATAVVGIDRPTNPGEHTIRIEAAGYAPAEQTLTLEEGEKQSTTLGLSGQSPPGETAEEGVSGEEQPPSHSKEPGPVGVMLGLRLALSVPAGKITDRVDTADVVGPGLAFELRGGIRIAQMFTPLVFGEFHTFGAGNQLGKAPLSDVVDSSATLTSGGLGLMVGTGRNVLGGFGEIGLSFQEKLKADIKGKNGNCSGSLSLSTPALRVGGGANIPVAHFLHLTPYAMVTVGKYTSFDVKRSGACPVRPDVLLLNAPVGNNDIPSGSQAAHAVFVIGIGGDFVFGPDKPVE